MGYPSLYPSQPGLVQDAVPVMGNNADVICRTLGSHFTSMTGGFKEPNQVFLFFFFFIFYSSDFMYVLGYL